MRRKTAASWIVVMLLFMIALELGFAQPDNSNPSCSDTDSGLDYYTPGSVTDKNGVTFDDYCEGTGNNLIEYYCQVNHKVGHETYDCGTTCIDGACLNNLTHSVCQNEQCLSVQGQGNDECIVDEECQSLNETHHECLDQSCVLVNGQGEDQCTADEQCDVPDQTHNECIFQTCTSVSGPGINQCTDDEQCSFNESHCGNGMCDDSETLLSCPSDCLSESGQRYLEYTLPDQDCLVSLSITALQGRITLASNWESDICTGLFDEYTTAMEGETKVLTHDNLNEGNYSIIISGTGEYNLIRTSQCRNDTTPPAIMVHSLPEFINTTTLLVSDVSDETSGLRETCQVCITKNEECVWLAADHNFTDGDHIGTCTYTWNVSEYDDGQYTVHFRTDDLANNSGRGMSTTSLDRLYPDVTIVTLTSPAEAEQSIHLVVNASDLVQVAWTTAEFQNQTYPLLLSEQGFYETSFSAAALPDSYALLIESSDTAGHVTYLTRTIRVNELINWSDDLRLTFGEDANKPALAIDSRNHVHAVWHSTKTGNSEIWYTQFDETGRIIVHEKQISHDFHNSMNPSIAIDNDDSVAIVWVDDRDSNQEIYYSKIDSSGSVVHSEIRLTHNVHNSNDPQAVIDESGVLNLIWIDDREGTPLVHYKPFSSDGTALRSAMHIPSESVRQFSSDGKSELALCFITEDNTLHLARIDSNGNIVQNTPVANDVQSVSLAVGDATVIGWTGQNRGIHTLQFDATGALNWSTNISTTGTATSPSVTVDSEGSLHVTWVESGTGSELHFAKQSSSGYLLVSNSRVGFETEGVQSPAIATDSDGSIHIMYADAVEGEGSIYLKTTFHEQTAPIISSVLITDIGPYDAHIAWRTDEPTTGHIAYSFDDTLNLTYKDTSFGTEHHITLSDLVPGANYLFSITSSDIFKNQRTDDNSHQHYTFSTEQTKNKPALPTTFYGLVTYRNNTPVEGIDVTASWIDTDDVEHSSKTTSLTKQGALALNISNLTGYYLFNSGKIKAKEGSPITVSAPEDITSPDPYVLATPGGPPTSVTDGPIVLDITPPRITIQEPQPTTYFTTSLAMKYAVSEEIEHAVYILNENEPVTITDLKGELIPFTAQLGVNNLTIIATDLIGMVGRSSVFFEVNDTVPPQVTITSVGPIGKIALLSADVDDSTNELKQSCEVCISFDGACDSEWTDTDVINDFTVGDLFGQCLFEWDTTPYDSTQVTINFRVKDITENSGTGESKLVSIDNSPPLPVTGLVVTSIHQENALDLTWHPNEEDDVAGYAVYRDISPFFDVQGRTPITLLSGRTNTTYKDTGLESQARYFYAVAAKDTIGNENYAVISQSGIVDDTSPPIITLLSPRTQSYTDERISLNYTTNEPVSWCAYSLNNGSNTSTTEEIIGGEGENILVVYCSDSANNIGQSERIHFTVDTTPPSKVEGLTVTSVSHENKLHLEWQPNPEEDLAHYAIYRQPTSFEDVKSIQPLKTTTATHFIDENLNSDTTYNYGVTAVDLLGQEDTSVASVSGRVDDYIPPEVNISSPLNQVYTSSEILLEFAVNEPVSACWYILNSEETTDASSGDTVHVPEGSNSLILLCNDTAGNIGADVASFDVDSKIPDQIQNLQVHTIDHQPALTLIWNVSTARDLAYYSIYRSTQSFSEVSQMIPVATTVHPAFTDTDLMSEGTYYYAVTPTDIFDNENIQVVSEDGTVADVEAPPPVTQVDATPIPNDPSVVITWNHSSADDFSHYNVYRSASPFVLIASIHDRDTLMYTDSGLEQGYTYKYKVTTVDENNNENMDVTAVEVTTVDLEPPIISVTSPENRTYNSAEIPLTYMVNEDVSLCRYSLNDEQAEKTSEFITGQEGENTIKVVCDDISSNSGESSTITFYVDTTPPGAIQNILVEDIPTEATLRITWQASPSADFMEYRIYRSLESFTDISEATRIVDLSDTTYIDTGLESEKTYWYAVTAIDTMYNELHQVISFAGTVDDVSPPSKVTGLSVQPVRGINSLNITWKRNSEPDFDRYKIYRLSEPFSDVTDMTTLTQVLEPMHIDNNLESSEVWYYAVTAIDKRGNENPSVNAVRGQVADTLPPNIEFSSPAEQKYNRAVIPLTFNSNEPLQDCSYSLNGEPRQIAPQKITAPEGVNLIMGWCNDTSGNEGAASDIQFTVDLTAPDSINDLTVAPVDGKGQLTLSWSPSTASDLSHYVIYSAAASFTSTEDLTPIAETQETSFTHTGLTSEGTYWYAVAAVDDVDNELKSVVSMSGTVDDVRSPQITIISPQNKIYGDPELSLLYIADEPTVWCTYQLNADEEIELSHNISLTCEEGENTLTVRCEDTSDNIGVMSVSFTVDLFAPDPVMGLTASPISGINALDLQWQHNTEPDIHHYNIYRSLYEFTSVEGMEVHSASAVNTYRDADLVSEGVYFYAITAEDIFENENTEVVSVMGIVADTIPPSAVGGLAIEPFTDQVGMHLSWNPVGEDIDHYTIYRDTEQFTHITNQTSLGDVSSTSFDDFNVMEGRTYHYGITAIDEAANENRSVSSVAGKVIDVTPPTILVHYAGQRIAGIVTISASIYDEGIGLAHSCAVCLAADGICDSEWTTKQVVNGFEEGDSTGTCMFTVDTTTLDKTTYTYNFRVGDLDNNTKSGISQSSEVIAVNFMIHHNLSLHQGWNLISVPLMLTDSSPSASLNPINSQYRKIYHYNNKEDSWDVYNPARTVFDEPNTLVHLSLGESYWIDMISPAKLTLTGMEEVNRTFHLDKGWNFIGYPYPRETSVEDALSSISDKYNRIYTYNNNLNKWDVYSPHSSLFQPNSITHLKPGVGYLIDMKSDAQWSP